MVKKRKKPIKKISRKIEEKKAEIQPEKIKKTKIRMIGIGGGAGAIVSEIASRMPRATFVAANTDLKALRTTSRKVIRFLFGNALTRGLGTGMKAELGREAALADKDKIKNLLLGQDLVILVASLGGGAGSGAVPIFAKISKKLGNLTYGIFTLPFRFEGEKKMEIARDALKKVRNYLNAFSVIPNERVFQIINKETPLKQALSTINKMLSKSLGGLIETIYTPGLINIDFADFRTILEGRGRLCYLNTVEVPRKKGQIQNLINEVLNSPLYPYTIRGAKGVLFNIAGEKDLSLSDVSQISKTISDLTNPEAKIIFGVSQGQKYSNIIKTTLLANGCTMKIFSFKTKLPFKEAKVKKRTKSSLPTKKKKIKKTPKPQKIIPPKKVKEKPIKKLKKRKRKKLRIVKKKIAKKIKKTKPKQRRTKVKEVKESEKKEKLPSRIKKETKQSFSPINNEETIRKNALQIKKEAEELEKEMVEREQFWETPAFLRKKFIK